MNKIDKYKQELYHKLTIVSYFKTENIEIELFNNGGNDKYKELTKAELLKIRENNNISISSLYQTRDFLSINKNYNCSKTDFELLLIDKFKESEHDNIKDYCIFEIEDLELRYSNLFGFFPILKKWKNFLTSKLENIKSPKNNNRPSYTYTTIFKKQTNAQKLKDFFELQQLTKNGIWQKNEDLQNLASFFYYLQHTEIIKKDLTIKYALPLFYTEYKAKGAYGTITRVSKKFIYKPLLQDYVKNLKTYFSID